MNVLSIGNSFSQDAQRYLHGIARADDMNLRTVNLYIGGCSLSTHYRNMLSREEVYSLELNGESTGFTVSMEKALLSQEWDFVTLQQASHYSNDYETYQPFLNEIAEYVRKMCPKTKILIHETWAYEQNSDRLVQMMKYVNAEDMYSDVHKAYEKAAEDIKADGVIPSGTLLQRILSSGISKIHRDTFHASYGAGRYALGLLWYTIITGNNVSNNLFCDFDEDITEREIEIIKECVEETMRTKYFAR